MPVETPSIFTQVINDHLALKERNAQLDDTMPIERYKGDTDPFVNHPLFKSEEQARIEETMDGVDPDFSDETLEDLGLGVWPIQEPAAPAEAWSAQPDREDAAVLPPEAEETTGFWNTGGPRDFNWD